MNKSAAPLTSLYDIEVYWTSQYHDVQGALNFNSEYIGCEILQDRKNDRKIGRISRIGQVVVGEQEVEGEQEEIAEQVEVEEQVVVGEQEVAGEQEEVADQEAVGEEVEV